MNLVPYMRSLQDKDVTFSGTTPAAMSGSVDIIARFGPNFVAIPVHNGLNRSDWQGQWRQAAGRD